MKKFLGAVASIALLSAPLASIPSPALAHPGGGAHSGGFGGGFRGGYGYLGAGALGLAVGLDYRDPLFYDDPFYYDDYYGDYAYGAPYDYGPDGALLLAYQGPPPQTGTPQACGSWSWDAPRSTYNWVPC